jgi:hypothetical protein
MQKNLISRVMSHLAKLRAENLGQERIREIGSKGGRAAWDGLTPEERSQEMKKRWKVRRQKAKDKAR